MAANGTLLYLALCSVALAVSNPPRFSGRQDYGPSGWAAVGDLDGNGIPDMVTVGYFGTLFQTLLNNGDGIFRPGPSFTEGRNSTCDIALADLDGDRKADLLFTNGTLNVARGMGKGVFEPAVSYSLGQDEAIGGLAVGDFNGDGILDVVVPSAHGIWFFAGDKHGTLAPGVIQRFGAHFGGAHAVAADFNGDGKLDLAVNSHNGLSVLLGNGDGTFQRPVPYNVPTGPNWMAIGDLNQDGYPDIVVGGGPAQRHLGIITVFLNNGSGGFTQANSFATRCGPIAVGSLNGDGKADLVCDGWLDGYVHVFPGLSNGEFGPSVAIGVEDTQARSILLAPLTRTGALDIVVGQNNGMSVLLNKGHGKFPDGVWTPVRGSGDCGAAADFNGDGKPDLAVIDSQGITILFGTGKAGAPFTTGPTIPLSGVACPIAGDLNGDGIPDLLVGADSLGGVGAYLGNGDGTFRLAAVSTDITPCFDIVLADFNKDGIQDFATSANQMALGNGNGTFQAATSITTSPPPGCCDYVATGDVNNDGWPDIVIASGQTFAVELNNQNGEFIQSEVPCQYGCYAISLADLKGDGNLDAVVTNAGGANVFVGNGQGGFTAGSGFLGYPGPDNLILQVADVNGDGIPDVLLPADASVGVAIGNGDGTFQPEVAFGVGPGVGRILTENLHGQSPKAGLPDIVAPDGTGIGVVVLINRTK